MGQNGRPEDEKRDGLDGAPEKVSVIAPVLHESDAGRFTVDELVRARAAEEPRSLMARLFGADPIGAESAPLFARVLGERAMGALFAQLDDSWTVLHSIPVGSAGNRLDHLLIGSAGVFTVTTRSHPGEDIAVTGRVVLAGELKVPHIRDAELALGNAERRLGAALGESLVVTGLLVFVDPKSLSLHAVPKDLEVLSSREVLQWLEAQPEVFDTAEATRVAEVARLTSTWDAPPTTERQTGTDEFDGLLRLVARASSLRQLWFGAVTLVIVVAATALATLAIVGMIPRGGAH